VSCCEELTVYIARQYTTTSFFIEKHIYDMFRIFIDPSSGHISLRRLRYCNVITCRLSLRYYKNVKVVIKNLKFTPFKPLFIVRIFRSLYCNLCWLGYVLVLQWPCNVWLGCIWKICLVWCVWCNIGDRTQNRGIWLVEMMKRKGAFLKLRIKLDNKEILYVPYLYSKASLIRNFGKSEQDVKKTVIRKIFVIFTHLWRQYQEN
jgi:hypothetical protein